MKRKEKASLAGLVLVGIVAVFLSFVPDIVKEDKLTLRQAVLIAVGLTVASFVCFAVEKIETGKEDRKRELAEAHRDNVMKQILSNQMKARHSPKTAAKLQNAYDMYETLERSSGGPPPLVKELINKAVGKAMDILGDSVFLSAVGMSGGDINVFETINDPVEFRKIADALALNALTESGSDAG